MSSRKDKVEAYRIGEDIWGAHAARGKAGTSARSSGDRTDPRAEARRVRLNFKVNATVIMQLDAEGTIVAAEETDRSLLVVEEQAPE